METSLQSTNLNADELATSPSYTYGTEYAGEEETHIHLPNPSYWPIILGVAVLVTIAGFLIINTSPIMVLVGAVFVFIGIMGWALEDPMSEGGRKMNEQPKNYQEATLSGRPTPLAESVLHEAQDVVDDHITFGNTEYSAHPVKVYVEREGVVLSLYGKVELETQKKEIEDALRKRPGVIDVMNFLVAEDALLNAANMRIEALQKDGKLDGAKNIRVLVENYIINLYGDVPDSGMKYLLEKELIGIAGVKVVVNHINLNKDIPGNLGKTSNRIGA